MRKGSFFDGFFREKGVDIIAGGGGRGGGWRLLYWGRASMASPLGECLPPVPHLSIKQKVILLVIE